MNIGKEIERLRKEKGMTLEELGDKCGVGKSTVRKWEKGIIKDMRRDKIASLSSALGVSPSYFFESEIPSINKSSVSDAEFDNIFPIKVHKYPLLGEVACGEPIFMSEERENYIMAGTDVEADFCLIAKGDSMINARIMDGDVVFIRKQPIVENGEIAAVAIDDEATLKRFYRDEGTGTITLVAENPAYAPMVFTEESQKNVYILGKAIAFQSDVK